MSETAPTLDADAMARARALLTPKPRQEKMWPVLVAAAVMAISALTFATAMILAPPLVLDHVAASKSVG